MFCLRCEPVGPALCPLGATPPPDGGGQMRPERNLIHNSMEPILLPGHLDVGSSSPVHLLSLKAPPLASEAGQAASGGPQLPSAQVELACCLQSLVLRLCDVELPGFIPKGFETLPVHVSRPTTRGAEMKASTAIAGCSTFTEREVTGLKRYQQPQPAAE